MNAMHSVIGSASRLGLVVALSSLLPFAGRSQHQASQSVDRLQESVVEAGSTRPALPWATPQGIRDDKGTKANLPQPVLKADRLRALNKALQDWYADDVEANDKKREQDEERAKSRPSQAKLRTLSKDIAKLRAQARADKRKFVDAIEADGKKVGGDLLKQIPDLLAIFDG